jgi:transposase-like protein
MIFIRSFLITGIISVLFGFALRNVFGFWEALSLAFVIQFLVAFSISSFRINKVQALTGEFEGELQQLLDLNEVSVPCPCGNYVHTDNVFLNLENSFTCEKCNNDFKLVVNITPTLVTEIVDVDQAVANFAKEAKDVEITSDYKQGTEL